MNLKKVSYILFYLQSITLLRLNIIFITNWSQLQNLWILKRTSQLIHLNLERFSSMYPHFYIRLNQDFISFIFISFSCISLWWLLYWKSNDIFRRILYLIFSTISSLLIIAYHILLVTFSNEFVRSNTG